MSPEPAVHPAPFDQHATPFRIKICGMKTAHDVEAAAAVGCDAIGLNFYKKSPRSPEDEALFPTLAAESHSAGLKVVGLFVNTPAPTIRALAETLKLDFVQLHGDESPEFVAELRGLKVIRAFRVAPGELSKVEEYIAACSRLDALPYAMLIDGFSPTAYGGTGERADWAALATWPARARLPPLILAGGLSPENVSAAIRAVRPAGVDVASGVESSVAVKSPDLIAAFASAAKRGFAGLD